MSVRTRTGARALRPVRWFVGVAARRQTYLNLAYLALTFPLGIAYLALTFPLGIAYLALTFPLGLAYLVVLTMGVSLGVGLLVVLVGAPILVGLFLLTDRLLVFERWQARALLDEEVPLDRESDYEEAWDYLRSPLSDVGTWIGLLYLASKFVLGTFTFVVLVMFGSFAGSFLLAPFYYRYTTVQVQVPEPIHVTFRYAVQHFGGVEVITLPVTITSWQVTTLPEALAVSAVGALVLVVSLHLCNVLAKLQGWYVRLLIKPRPMAHTRWVSGE